MTKRTLFKYKVIAVVFVVGLFFIGYAVSALFEGRPMNAEQFAQCEQVANDVYAQIQKEHDLKEGQFVVKVSENFSARVSIYDNTITVKSASWRHRGKVIGEMKLQEGGFVTTQNNGTAYIIVTNAIKGVGTVVIGFAILSLIAVKPKKK